MDRNLLWKELKKINPATTLKWPGVKSAELISEIKKVKSLKNLKSQLVEYIVKKNLKNKRFENKIEKKETKNLKKKSHSFYKFLTKPIDSNKIKISKNEINSLVKNIKFIKLNPKFFLEIEYIVNDQSTYKVLRNIEQFYELIEKIKNGGYFEESTIGYGSDIDVIMNFINIGGILKLRWFDKTNYHKTHSGSYFKYFHLLNRNVYSPKGIQSTINVDLTKYQVYTKFEKINYEPCLYYSFQQAGVDENILDELKFLIMEKDVLLRDLKEIANIINYQINVTYNDNRDMAVIRTYNKDCENIINLGLVDGHYFLNEETKYTSKIFTGNRDSRNRKLMSYDIIRKLYVKREEFLKPITIENINNHLHWLNFEKDYELRDLKNCCNCKDSFLYDAKTHNGCLNIGDKCKYSEFKKYTANYNTKIFKGKFKPANDPNNNYKVCFLDLETYSNEDNIHKAYCLSYSYEKDTEIKTIYGLDCCKQFLDLLDCNTIIITHNLAFDFRGFIEYLTKLQTPIETGTKLKAINAKYKNYYLAFKDNCAFLPFKLSTLPKMFGLKSGDKGVYPYTLINEKNIDQLIDLNDVIKHLKKDEIDDFINNCKKNNFISWRDVGNNNIVNIKDYTIHYCEQDVNILKHSYLTFRNQILEITNLDILFLLSLPQLADTYFYYQGVFDDCYKINSVAQDFIRKACHGGRVMTRKNEKIHVKDKILSDFDAVSLYPSAMNRLPGYLKGYPKLIKNNIDWFNQDYYFVEIEITNIKTKRDFPLISKVDDNGIKNYTNNVIGHKLVVDKTTLEDLIEFHDIEYNFIRGYYFNDGFNTKIQDVIQFMFNERLKYKKQGNPIQNAYKLILNASYGKLIQKPIKNNKVFYESKDYRNYIIRNAKSIIEYYKIRDNLICVKKSKSIINHYTGCHMASQVLSMSKRIMNEVMCLSEDLNMKIYYQDTDSMHIEQQHIKPLSHEYQVKYQRELIGSKMGQFHSDFDVSGADKDYDINAVESIFLGKKAYVDKLEYKQNGEIKYDFHIRMKGMPSQIIKNYNEDIMKTYLDLYNGKEIKLDMVSCCPLEFTKDYKAINRESFPRTLVF